MSIFDPESKETPEVYREGRELSEKTEAQLMQRIAEGHDRFPDSIGCPNGSCQNPLKVNVREEDVELLCSNCGFTKIYQKKN